MAKVVIIVWLLTGVLAVLVGYGLWRLGGFVVRTLTSANSDKRR